MPVVVSAKVSADAGNQMSMTASGLYVPPAPGDTNPAYIVDNSWADAGSTFYYEAGNSYNSATFTHPLNTALLIPLMLTKTAKVTSVSFNVLGGGAGSTVGMNFALYASHPATGWPTTKVTDCGSGLHNQATMVTVPVAAAGQVALTGRTLYWMASWLTGTTTGPSIAGRANQMAYPVRQPAMPTTTTGSTFALNDTSVAWNTQTLGPASVNPSLVVYTSGSVAPLLWLGITN